MKSSPNEVNWNKKCDDAFEMLCSSPILRSPDFEIPFTLQTDASDRGVGAVLSQESEDGEGTPSATSAVSCYHGKNGTQQWRRSAWPLNLEYKPSVSTY